MIGLLILLRSYLAFSISVGKFLCACCRICHAGAQGGGPQSQGVTFQTQEPAGGQVQLLQHSIPSVEPANIVVTCDTVGDLPLAVILRMLK